MTIRVLEDINIVLLLYTSTSNYRIRSDLTVRTCTRTRTENRNRTGGNAKKNSRTANAFRSARPAENTQGTVRYRNNTDHGLSKRTRTPTSLSPLNRFSPVGFGGCQCALPRQRLHSARCFRLIFTIGTYIQLGL